MKHYLSVSMLEREIARLRIEIAIQEKKIIKNSKASAGPIKQLRLKLHNLKQLLLTKTKLKNGRK